jgi:hypothetical protein
MEVSVEVLRLPFVHGWNWGPQGGVRRMRKLFLSENLSFNASIESTVEENPPAPFPQSGKNSV